MFETCSKFQGGASVKTLDECWEKPKGSSQERWTICGVDMDLMWTLCGLNLSLELNEMAEQLIYE